MVDVVDPEIVTIDPGKFDIAESNTEYLVIPNLTVGVALGMAEVIKSPNSIDKPIWKRGLMNIVYSEDNPELMPLQIGLKTKELLSHFSNRDKAKLFLIS